MAAKPIEVEGTIAGKYVGTFKAAISAITAPGEISDSSNVSPEAIKVDQTCYPNVPVVIPII